MQVKGRYLILAWAAVFLAAVAASLQRDESGFVIRDDLDAKVLPDIRALEAARSALQTDISRMSNISAIGPRAAALGLVPASDSENIELSIPDHR